MASLVATLSSRPAFMGTVHRSLIFSLFKESLACFLATNFYFHKKFLLMKIVSAFFVFVLVAACKGKPQSPFDTTIYGRNPKAGHYVNTRGFKMYYETYGEGQPLLIIHGNGGSINNFLYQIPYFSKEYKVVIADSRAQGKSTDTADSLSYEMMADDLNALLDSLHLDSCYVIGWSDGGINGLLLAIHHSEKVKKLAVTGANLWPDTSAINAFAYNWAMNLNATLQSKPQTAETKA